MSHKVKNAKTQIKGAMDAASISIDTHKDKLVGVIGAAGLGIVTNIGTTGGTVGFVGAVTASLPALAVVGVVGGAGVAVLAGYGVYKFWRESSEIQANDSSSSLSLPEE
jgi:hypothetical protein